MTARQSEAQAGVARYQLGSASVECAELKAAVGRVFGVQGIRTRCRAAPSKPAAAASSDSVRVRPAHLRSFAAELAEGTRLNSGDWGGSCSRPYVPSDDRERVMDPCRHQRLDPVRRRVGLGQRGRPRSTRPRPESPPSTSAEPGDVRALPAPGVAAATPDVNTMLFRRPGRRRSPVPGTPQRISAAPSISSSTPTPDIEGDSRMNPWAGASRNRPYCTTPTSDTFSGNQTSSSEVRFFTRLGSTGIPGPIVVEKVAFFT